MTLPWSKRKNNIPIKWTCRASLKTRLPMTWRRLVTRCIVSNSPSKLLNKWYRTLKIISSLNKRWMERISKINNNSARCSPSFKISNTPFKSQQKVSNRHQTRISWPSFRIFSPFKRTKIHLASNLRILFWCKINNLTSHNLAVPFKLTKTNSSQCLPQRSGRQESTT